MNDNSRVIVLGASAGGVEALLRLVPRLPPEFAAPIVLVLHIGAHRSYLPKLLEAKGSLKAEFAAEGTVPRPGHVYVAPSDHHVLFEDGRLRLFHGPKEHHARPAINPLFRSAALELGPRVVGVVLTGLLDDGTSGLAAVKACGGTAVVQDPEDAAEPSMPRSALASVDVDHVASLDDMAGLLIRLAQPLASPPEFRPPAALRIEHEISLGKASMKELQTIATPSGYTCPDCGGALFELSDERPLRFLCHTGHGFSLRSLALSQVDVAEEALYAAIKALQEKESLLRRLAATQGEGEAPQAASSLGEADELAALIVRMRVLVSEAPAEANDLEGSVEAAANEP